MATLHGKTRLGDLLMLMTTMALQVQARIQWNQAFSPPAGWRGIRHTSQRQKRIRARR